MLHCHSAHVQREVDLLVMSFSPFLMFAQVGDLARFLCIYLLIHDVSLKERRGVTSTFNCKDATTFPHYRLTYIYCILHLQIYIYICSRACYIYSHMHLHVCVCYTWTYYYWLPAWDDAEKMHARRRLTLTKPQCLYASALLVSLSHNKRARHVSAQAAPASAFSFFQ